MSKKYPYYGKRFARQKINEFAEVIFQIYRMDARQLRAIRKEAEQFFGFKYFPVNSFYCPFFEHKCYIYI